MSFFVSKTQSCPAEPTGASVNTEDSKNKMTKSYLLESEAYLKTNCKSMANATVPVDVAPSSRMRHRAHHHHHHHHHPHHHHQHNHHPLHPQPLNSTTDDLLFGINIWSHTARDPIVSGLERGKPLTLHNVAAVNAAAANFPPIAYINGNSVRPIRCRHYSAQQTVLPAQAQTRSHHNTGAQVSLMEPLVEPMTDLLEKSVIDDSEYNNSAHRIRSVGANNGAFLSSMNGSKPFKVPSAGRISGNRNDDDTVNVRSSFAAHQQRSSFPSDNVSFGGNNNNNSNDYSNDNNVDRVPSASAGRLNQRNYDISNNNNGGVSSSPRTASTVAVDDDFGDENDSNVYSLCGGENGKKVVEHLSKRIEGVLRSAKESRRLVCNELLVPQALTANIAQDVIKTAECEPCGLRGCVLRICIEDPPAATNITTSNSNTTTSSNTGAPATTATTLSLTSSTTNGSSTLSTHAKDTGALSSSRLLGEIVLDSSLVPTFEVFLVLKRARTNWLDSLESKLLGRERIVLSEIYLFHKKKLY